jgi:hypothetical protein
MAGDRVGSDYRFPHLFSPAFIRLVTRYAYSASLWRRAWVRKGVRGSCRAERVAIRIKLGGGLALPDAVNACGFATNLSYTHPVWIAK